MKNRTVFALALCLSNTMSFAYNGTDAPLVVGDPYSTVQQDQSASAVRHHRDKKKTNSCPPQTAQSAVKSPQRKAKEYPEPPTQRDMSTM
jgi:hypothetical protein